MLRALLLISLIGAAAAADTPALDAAMARRAQAAAKAIDRPAAAPADPAAIEIIDDAEKHLGECRALLATGSAAAAGDAFVLASATLGKLTDEQQAGLGKRYQDALKKSVALGRQLLAGVPALAAPVPAAESPPDVTNR